MTDAGERTPDPDGIVVALSSIALGAFTGGLFMTAGTLAVRVFPTEVTGSESPAFVVLTVAVALGFGGAIVTAFGASRPVDNLWRRAVIGAIALFGAAILSVLAAPIDMFAGPGGLIAWLALLLAGWGAALHTRRRAGAA